MHKKSVCAVIAALMVLLAGPATASVFLKMDQSELIAKASAIVDGRVIKVDSFWNDEHTAIHTEAVVAIDDFVAGDAPATVVIRTPGGQVDDYVIEAVGCPQFEKGQRVLLFLTPDRGDMFRVLGYQQGRAAHTLVSNVPGPLTPMYFCGAQMVDTTGLGPVLDGMGLNNGIGSYGNRVTFCFTADRAALPDPEVYERCLSAAVDELLAAARARNGS